MPKEPIRNIVILTGAGLSADSGLATFRGADGLWEGHRVEDVATPHAYATNPALVHQFYDARRARLDQVEPNAAHHALARLDSEWRGELLIRALAPLAELADYATELRAVTAGRGRYSMELSHYEPAPPAMQRQLREAWRPHPEED